MSVDTLKKHFLNFFANVAEGKFSNDAGRTKAGSLDRIVTGIPSGLFNLVMGETDKKGLQEQIDYFRGIKLPFLWGLDHGTNPSLFEDLKGNGLVHCGVMQGVMGSLNKPYPEKKLPSEYKLEPITSDKDLNDFCDLVGEVFAISGQPLEGLRIAAKNMMKEGKMTHWLARKNGEAVSTISIFQERDVATFWNGATKPELRKQGISTALRTLALNDAIAKEAKLGGSYLMAAGMAYNICRSFGFETKWKFDYFLKNS